MIAIGLRTLAAFAPPPKLRLSEWIEAQYLPVR